MLWSDARIEEVKTLAGQGWSAGQIAKHLGDVTRNSVVGIGHRKNFQFHGGGGGANHKAKIKQPQSDPLFVAEECVTTGNLTLLELKETSCKWPIGDPQHDNFRFCGGHRREGYPYCGTHCRAAYEPRLR